jgi:hypothetical protein
MHSFLWNMPIPSCAEMLLKMSLTLAQVGAKTLWANLTPLMHCLFPMGRANKPYAQVHISM